MVAFNEVRFPPVTETRERVIVEEVEIEPAKDFLDIRFNVDELACFLAILENQCWHDNHDGLWPSSTLYKNIHDYIIKVKGADWWKYHKARYREWRKARSLAIGDKMNDVAYVSGNFENHIKAAED